MHSIHKCENLFLFVFKPSIFMCCIVRRKLIDRKWCNVKKLGWRRQVITEGWFGTYFIVVPFLLHSVSHWQGPPLPYSLVIPWSPFTLSFQQDLVLKYFHVVFLHCKSWLMHWDNFPAGLASSFRNGIKRKKACKRKTRFYSYKRACLHNPGYWLLNGGSSCVSERQRKREWMSSRMSAGIRAA